MYGIRNFMLFLWLFFKYSIASPGIRVKLGKLITWLDFV